MKTIAIAALLLATVILAIAQGLTRDIVLGTTILTVQEGRIVGITEPPSSTPAPNLRAPRLPPPAARREQVTPAVAPAPVARAQTTTTLGPTYTLDLSSGVRVTVAATNTFDAATLQRILREASQKARQATSMAR